MVSKSFTVIYASQTGQAKSIAENICDLASKNNFNTKLYCVSEYDKKFQLNNINEPVVFIISTTGDGETPETARKCYSKLKDKTLPKNYLENLNYALLGLGDTNYTQFCNGPKLFYKLFQQLNAKCFYGPAWADDGTGLECVVEPFIEGLWDALNKQISSNETNKLSDNLSKLLNIVNDYETPLSGMELTVPQLADQHLNMFINYILVNEKSDENLFIQKLHPNIQEAVVIEKNVLTTSDSLKTCYKLQFQISDTFEYEPGHAIDVIAENDDNELNMLFERLGITKDEQFKVIKLNIMDTNKKAGLNLVQLSQQTNMCLYFLFKYCLDIRSNSLKKGLLRMLADMCNNPNEKRRLLELCSKEGNQQYQDLIKNTSFSLLDLLNTFKSCKPPIDYLIQMLSPLNTRSYSLCSCMNVNNKHEIMFNLIKFDSTQLRTYERYGITTGHLSKLNANEKFYFVKRSLQNFALKPEYLNEPIIMISHGTGIAPFMSFLRYKKLNKSEDNLSNWWLLYGCRDPNKDFLYKEEILKDFVGDSKIIDKFYVAFSRITLLDSTSDLFEHYVNDTKYVQDLIKAKAKDLCNLIVNKNAIIYVCGDENNMIKDVFNCIVNCLQLSEYSEQIGDAQKYVLDMMNKKRYKQDIWN